MKKIAFSLLCLCLLAGMSFSADKQKPENKKFAIGYSQTQLELNLNNVGAATISKVAGRYWFNDTIGIDASLGFSGGDSQSAFLLGGKVLGKIISAKQLDIYWLAGLNFGSYDPKINGINSFTIFQLTGGVGAEYYILPSLSILTELGIQYLSASSSGNNSNNFGIFADWIPQAGVRFYF